jgi:DNA polymerase-3 subunit alpha
MCALINSEDPNSDKVQEYLDECRKMDIEILPPNVNNSAGLYRILEDGNISTGLSAIKGVGEKAIESIIEYQPYENYPDFLSRNDSRTVGKTVIQSLSKAGALDPFERTRKDMHDNYQKYRSKAKTAIKKVVESKIFENNPTFKKIPKEQRAELYEKYAIPKDSDEFLEIVSALEFGVSEEDWDRKEILLSEREVLGRSLSGNLHEVFKSFFSGGTMVTKLSDIDSLNSGARIKVEVIIKTKIKEFKIKNGKNIGKKFAKYLIEDINGDTCGLTLWAEDYMRYRTILKDGIPIKAICRVNTYLDQKDLALSSLERVYGREL